MATNIGTDVKWLYCQRVDGGQWCVRFVSGKAQHGEIEDSRIYDETQICEMNRSEFAIFKNCEGWCKHKPRRYLDLRDKSYALIHGLGGLINSLPANWF